MAKKREFLAALLEVELGHRVHPADLWPAQGFERSDSRSDTYRWSGSVRFGEHGTMVVVDSWETMTELCRTGIDVDLSQKQVNCCSDPERAEAQKAAARKLLKGK